LLQVLVMQVVRCLRLFLQSSLVYDQMLQYLERHPLQGEIDLRLAMSMVAIV
jgi:hypothetical protein